MNIDLTNGHVEALKKIINKLKSQIIIYPDDKILKMELKQYIYLIDKLNNILFVEKEMNKLSKIIEDMTDEELYTTGWVTVNDSLAWNSTYSIGSEMVYAFWIDAWEKSKLGEFDRIYVNVEINADDNAVIWHSNDSTYNDIFIDVPLRL